MSTIVSESWDSPRSTLLYSGQGEDSAETEYYIEAAATSADAYNAVLGEAPPTLDGLLLRTIDMEPAGPDCWRARCKYGQPKSENTGEQQRLAVGSYRISFSTRGGRVLQTASRAGQFTAYGPPGRPAPDHKGAINVTENGVEGVEVDVPALTFQVTKHQPGATLTQAYAMAVAGITGGWNNASFLGFPRGTIKFTGADGQVSVELESPIPGGPAIPAPSREITYGFEFSPNVEDITIGDITGIDKLGHQYLWIMYEQEQDTTAQNLVRRPRAVYVHTVGTGEVDLGILDI